MPGQPSERSRSIDSAIRFGSLVFWARLIDITSGSARWGTFVGRLVEECADAIVISPQEELVRRR